MKVLIVEDEAVSRRFLEATTAKLGYEVVVTDGGEAALAALAADDCPRLVVLDWVMPGIDGLEVCRRIRARDDGGYFYLILLTARDRTEDVVAGMEAGADDYIRKPCIPAELGARLRAGERIIKLQQDLLSAQAALSERASHDSLTGLWNSGAICEVLERELARAEREGRPLAVIMADIDHFKRVNDTYGHPAGDVALCEIARRLKAGVRQYDSVGRFGGEEFLIIIPGCDEERAAVRAEELRRSIGEREIEVPGASVKITMSLGVAACDECMIVVGAALVKSADEALYRAKRAGRNRVVSASAVKFGT